MKLFFCRAEFWNGGSDPEYESFLVNARTLESATHKATKVLQTMYERNYRDPKSMLQEGDIASFFGYTKVFRDLGVREVSVQEALQSFTFEPFY